MAMLKSMQTALACDTDITSGKLPDTPHEYVRHSMPRTRLIIDTVAKATKMTYDSKVVRTTPLSVGETSLTLLESYCHMKSSKPIIAILNRWYDQYQVDSIEFLTERLNRIGYGVVCITAREFQSNSDLKEHHAICQLIYSDVNNFRFDGLIALSGTFAVGADNSTISQFLNSFCLPKVSYGLALPDIPSVAFNQACGVHDLMQHLLKPGNKKEFVFIRGVIEDDHYSRKREVIFRNTLIENGVDEQRIHYINGNYNAYTAYRRTLELLTENRAIDCIVAANDIMAASAASAAKVLGLSIPKEISICGFDDSIHATSFSPALTTVRQPLKQLAEECVSLLLNIIESNTDGLSGWKRPKESFESQVLIDPELIIRGSINDSLTRASVHQPFSHSELASAMCGLTGPKEISLSCFSQALIDTLESGSSDLTDILSRFDSQSIGRYLHWWKNLCDHISNILREREFKPENVSCVNSAMSIVRRKIWAIETDLEINSIRSREIRSEFQFAMGSCNTMEDIVSALDEWLIKPKRCFLITYNTIGTKPDSSARVVHAYTQNEVLSEAYLPFNSKEILPDSMQDELSNSLLVLSPVYTDELLFGYLLMDPSELDLLYIDAAAVSIGNAMRTQYHQSELKAQRDSLKSVNEELLKLANFDALTGLANRLNFQKNLCSSLQFARETHRRTSLMFIDLDGFKTVNDTLGHDIGDLLLVKVGSILQERLARYSDFDSFISRLGGDEFTILLTHESERSNPKYTAEDVLRSLSDTIVIKDKPIKISASIGCATFPDDARDEDSLVKCADVAMYAAKNSGKDRCAMFGNLMLEENVSQLQRRSA